MRTWLALVTWLSTLVACGQARAEPMSLAAVKSALADGDVIFQESESRQSAAIKAATRSRYSHVGLVFGVAEGKPYVLEAVQPVRTTPLEAWIRRGAGAHFVLMRARERPAKHEAAELRREAERFLGRAYDLTFDWSDERIYCSELVWKVYERAWGVRLGEPEPWRALNLDDAKVRALAKKRLGKLPDPEAPVVTPVRILEAPQLERVLTGELP
jgi:hypothetical protein